MKRAILFFLLLAIALPLFSQVSEHVYEVIITGKSPCSESGAMPAAIEAMHFYMPTGFKRDGKVIQFLKDGETRISINPNAERLWLEGNKCMVRYTVALINPPLKPSIKRQIRVRFTLSELENKGGDYSNSPIMYAVKTGIEKSRLLSGRVWVENISFSKDRFDLLIAFSN
ncbi:hypothetical protein MASR2M29_04880 [Spirochaetota bacterium]